MRRFLTIIFLFSVGFVLFAQTDGNNCPPSMTNYWKLDETTGSPYLDFYGSDTAFSTNQPILTDGICGNAQSFNAGNQEIDVPVSDSFNWGIDDNFTIEYWLKSNAGSSGHRVAIGRDEDFPNLHWWSGVWEDGRAAFILFDRTGVQGIVRGTTNLIDDTWYHIVCIRDADADSIYIYVNGVREASQRVFYSAGFESSNADLNIGYLDLHGGYHFNGVVDEVALYNDALVESEIGSHYINGLQGICYCDDPGGSSDPDYVLLADEHIKLYRQRNSVGNVHSNGSILYNKNYWWTGYQTGDLSAVGSIYINKGNTIDGNASAGGDITLVGSAEVTGLVSPNTNVDNVVIPTADFSAGGDNVYVSFRKTKELAPGSYGNVRVKWLGKLKLTAGDYYFESLRTDFYSFVLADVSDGPVNIYVVGEIDFGPKSVVKAYPESDDDSKKLNVTTLYNGSVEFGGFGKYFGSFLAPNGYVKVGYYSRLKGSIAARKIAVYRGTQFVPHGYNMPFAKQPNMDQIEDETESTIVVEEYSLNQNYPNPFNPSTTLSFTLPEAGIVNLTVYDLLGQRVATLIDDNMSAGYHSTVFNANNLPSGIYIYRIVSENFSETKKMQLLK